MTTASRPPSAPVTATAVSASPGGGNAGTPLMTATMPPAPNPLANDPMMFTNTMAPPGGLPPGFHDMPPPDFSYPGFTPLMDMSNAAAYFATLRP